MKRLGIQAWLPGNAKPEQYSGARSRLLEHLRALRRVPTIGDWHVTLLVARSAKPDPALSAAIESLPRAALRPVDIPPAPTWRRVLAEGRALRRIEGDFDVFELASLPAPRLETPFNLLVHDLRDFDRDFARGFAGTRRWLIPRALRRAQRRARLLLVPSEAVREDFARRIPSARDKIRVVPPTVEVPPMCDWPSIESSWTRSIVSLARPEPRKDLGFALEVYARARSLAPMPRLCFAGPPDPRWEPLRRRAHELGIQNEVSFIHDLDDDARWPLLASARAMLFPTRLEGFGMPALEAALVGCPVLVRAGSVPHRVLGEHCVALEDDVASWADELHARMAERTPPSAPEDLAQRFHGARVARQWVETWEAARSPEIQASL